MPLTVCPDCTREVSTAAPACPHCGRPMETPPEPLLLEWHDGNLTVNRSREDTFALCLEAAKLTGLKYAVGPTGISIAGKTWKHNGAGLGLVVSPINAGLTNVTMQNETGHLGPGFGALSREVTKALQSAAAKLR